MGTLCIPSPYRPLPVISKPGHQPTCDQCGLEQTAGRPPFGMCSSCKAAWYCVRHRRQAPRVTSCMLTILFCLPGPRLPKKALERTQAHLQARHAPRHLCRNRRAHPRDPPDPISLSQRRHDTVHPLPWAEGLHPLPTRIPAAHPRADVPRPPPRPRTRRRHRDVRDPRDRSGGAYRHRAPAPGRPGNLQLAAPARLHDRRRARAHVGRRPRCIHRAVEPVRCGRAAALCDLEDEQLRSDA